MSVERFKCPDCGIGVGAYGDGCCVHCGADCEIVPVKVAQPKHEHEWVVGRTPWRLVFDDGGWWCIEESIGFGQWNRHDAPAAATDEFARLAGLTVPEGEK